MKLFAIYIGGEHAGANIEVHDVRFAVAKTIGDTHDQLRAEWWGKPGTLHIDCWAEIDEADGHSVSLQSTPASGLEKLYFINLGGYDRENFGEQHKNMFVVATSVMAAKARAIAAIAHWQDGHRDEFYEAELAFDLDRVIGGQFYIHLTAIESRGAPRFICRYTPLP